MRSLLCSLCSIGFLITVIGCGTNPTPKNRAAIVFGDSSTIVTETDPRYLNNNVQDIVIEEQVQKTDSPAVIAKADTVKTEVRKEEVETPKNSKGLSAPFKDCNIFIADVQARSGRNINWDKDKGASFTLEEGELNGKVLTIKGMTISKVMQRNQTVVMLKTPAGKSFKLPSLASSTSEWQSLKGKNGQYTIAGLGNGQLKYNARFTPKTLRNATQKLARNSRMSRKEEQKLLNSIRNVRTPNQSPCSIGLQSVIWKISGKDAGGKLIERELRVDLNL